MDEFFFDANDKDKPAHVTGFHDIGGGRLQCRCNNENDEN